MSIKIEDIRIRDPFVLCEGGKYYMYGTTSLKRGIEAGNTFSVYVSSDLKVFDEPITVYCGAETDRDYWAAEVHKYRGKYYMFASVLHSGKKRCSEIFISDSPLGAFEYYSAATPQDWTCLDATLYVENGKPYSVFCREWTEIGVGEIWAAELNQDLKGFAAAPQLLFSADAATWVNVSANGNGVMCAVTDGPFIIKQEKGIAMLWSSFTLENKYALGVSYADSLLATWRQSKSPLFADNGGHAMVFKTYGGKEVLSMHCPNDGERERAVFTDFTLEL